MIEDILTPTPEWLSKHTYEPPKIDQETNRRAGRHINSFEALFRRGDLDQCQFKAAEAFERHYHGAQGARVSMGDDTSDPDMHGGLARAHHARKIAEAEKTLSRKEYLALIMIMLEGRTLDQIGAMVYIGVKREILRARGLGVLCAGLDRLAEIWGLADRKARV